MGDSLKIKRKKFSIEDNWASLRINREDTQQKTQREILWELTHKYSLQKTI